MLRSLLFAFAFVVAAEVAAQPTLVVSPETLSYPAEMTFTAANAGSDSLTLSFPLTHHGFFGTVTGYGWSFEVETPDSLYEDVYLPFMIDDLPTIPLAPNTSAMFRIVGFDPCPVCAAEGESGGGFSSDTLFLRAATPSDADTVHVALDLSGYVPVEPSAPATAALHVDVYPNPARRTLNVVVESERATEVDVLVVDALGREVRRMRGVPATGQPFPLPLGNLPAGAYLVRAQAPDASIAVQRFVLVR